jgi:hypothetical protein
MTVLERAASDEAENRLHKHMGVLAWRLGVEP